MNLHEILFASKMTGNSEFDFSEYVKNTDFATKEKVGVMCPGGGLDVRNTGVVEIASATNAEISAGANNYKPIVPANLASAMSAYGIKTKTQIDEMLSILSELKNYDDSEIREISAKNQYTLGYSVKNLLKNSAKNKTINGIEFFVNATGRIDGISGDVDLDYAYKNYPEIIKNAGLNGFSKNIQTTEISVTVNGKTYSGTVTEK